MGKEAGIVLALRKNMIVAIVAVAVIAVAGVGIYAAVSRGDDEPDKEPPTYTMHLDADGLTIRCSEMVLKDTKVVIKCYSEVIVSDYWGDPSSSGFGNGAASNRSQEYKPTYSPVVDTIQVLKSTAVLYLDGVKTPFKFV